MEKIKIFLKNNIKTRVLNGHPWIYKNEIDYKKSNLNLDESDIEKGSLVEVYHKDTFIGTGYINPNSKIIIRLLSKEKIDINKDFFYKKIKKAINYRLKHFNKEDSFRAIFSESDGLPGLIVDKFGKYLSLQISTYGIYQYKSIIIDILKELFSPIAIFEKDDENFAKIEGFPPIDNWIYKQGPELIPLKINGINFFADTKGQKTGFFLDQRLNALEILKYSKGKICLDAFSYTGNFGIHTLVGGAKHTTFIDYSKRALYVLEQTLKANSIDKNKTEIINGNSFKILKKFESLSKKFDIVIIDPPSMTKSRNNLQNAIKGYKTLNKLAISILNNEGLLSTSSCTQLLYEEEFKKIIHESALKNNCLLKLIYRGQQPPDHPVVMNILETEYLKNYIFEIEKLK